MRLERAGVALAALLAASLGIKGLALARAEATAQDGGPADIVAFLASNGFATETSAPGAAPVWVTGRRSDCSIRIADVSPQGWFHAIVAAEARDGALRYAFKGALYAEQPVAATMLEDYRRRLMRYFGRTAPTLHVRAIVTAPDCPDGLIGPEQVRLLSR